MFKGIQLTLMIGPAVPLPVPRPVVEALESVRIISSAGDESGFELNFTISSKSVLNTMLLLLGEIGSIIRTVLFVTVNGIPHVLADGVLTNQEVSPDVQAGKSTVSLKGKDLTPFMNKIDFTGLPYPGMSEAAQVLLILAKYAAFGIIPKVIPPLHSELPNPLDRISSHEGTDLDHIKMLADRNGYVFYIEPGPVPGTNIAYWGPEIKIGIPQPALNINMDAHTNVESLSFNLDGEKRTLPIVYIHIKETKLSIPIPIPQDVSPLNPPLGIIPPAINNIKFLKHTAKLSPIKALAEGLAKASQTSDAVTGNGTLDVLRYGRVLKARQLVGVRGAGLPFNGLYYVKSVTHDIKRGEYKQSFTLTRNGLVSITPRVPV